MSQPIGDSKETTKDSEVSEEMSKYGITKKSIDHFYYGEYQYTNLRDALAQAKRTVEAAETGDAPGSR